MAATGEENAFEEDPETATMNENKLGADLIMSVRMGDVEQAKTLLSDGAPASFTDAGGWSALTWAASEGHTEIIDLLLEAAGPAPPEGEAKAAEPEELELEEEESEKTVSAVTSPLHWAAFKGHVHIVWKLLTAGH